MHQLQKATGMYGVIAVPSLQHTLDTLKEWYAGKKLNTHIFVQNDGIHNHFLSCIVVWGRTFITVASWRWSRGWAEMKTNDEEQLRTRQLEIQEETLRAVSRELHDNIAQKDIGHN